MSLKHLKALHCFISSSPLQQFDIDGDGSITSEELKHAMKKLLGENTSKKEIEAVVREADNNGDGTVDFEGEIQVHTNTHAHKDFVFFYKLILTSAV